jgi:hypothetical protein
VLLVTGALVGAGVEYAATRLWARSPSGGASAVPVVCSNVGAERCFQGPIRVKRPYVDDICTAQPEGYVWVRLRTAATASVFICQAIE